MLVKPVFIDMVDMMHIYSNYCLQVWNIMKIYHIMSNMWS